MMLAKVNPQSMRLTSHWDVTRTVSEWAEAQEINEIYEVIGDWAVTGYGLECLTTYYPIPAGRLWSGAGYYDWELHMGTKRWVNLPDFCSALAAARVHHGARGERR